MAFCSPIKKPARVVQGETDSSRSSTFGTPLRQWNSFTPRNSSSQTSRDTLTFLSPQPIFDNKVSPRISGLSKCIKDLGKMNISSQSVKEKAYVPTPKNPSVELSHLTKSCDTERRSTMMSTHIGNSKMNM